MLTPDQQRALEALAQRAATTILDLRTIDPSAIDNLSINFGTLRIAFAYERMPPDWRPYRHLSVSDAGHPPDEAMFLAIAEAVGMGDPATWNTDLVRLIERLLPMLRAKHAFRPADASDRPVS
jgi:hypothetical protein